MVQVTGERDDVRTAIVEAAARLLREEGVRAVTTRGVAQAAGVQAPTIYRLFRDKDGLVDAVAEHVMATYVAAKSATEATEATEATTPTDPTDPTDPTKPPNETKPPGAAGPGAGDPVAELRRAWGVHVEFGLANAELYTLLTAPGRGVTSPATAAGVEVLRARVRKVAAAGLLAVDEERAVHLIHAAGTGTVLALLGMPADRRDPGLADAMFDAVSRGILTTAPAAGGTDLTAVAVTARSRVPELPALTDAERTLMIEWLTRSLEHLD